MAKTFNPLSKKLGGGFFAFERKNFALKYFWSYEQALKADLSFENGFEASKRVSRAILRFKTENPEYRIFQKAKLRHYAKQQKKPLFRA